MIHTTKYYIDSEFMEDGDRIELLSIGVVCEDGREFYAESSDARWSRANEWVVANVLPHLHYAGLTPSFIEGMPSMPDQDRGHVEVMSRARIAGDLLEFVNAGRYRPEFWAYYGDYDWVVLCQLYGRMIDLPEGWPMYAMDVKQLAVQLGDPQLPVHDDVEHHALADAQWTFAAWKFLQEVKRQRFADLERVQEAALEVYRSEGRTIWIANANALLEDQSPFDVVMQGDAERVLALLNALAEGVVM